MLLSNCASTTGTELPDCPSPHLFSSVSEYAYLEFMHKVLGLLGGLVGNEGRKQ